MGSFIFVLTLGAPASMPGDDLLFHRLSDSTIGAVGFHGRVRDGIGWGTDAIATKQWSRCASVCEMWVKIDVVHLFKASLSEHRVLGVPATRRWVLANIWCRAFIIHTPWS